MKDTKKDLAAAVTSAMSKADAKSRFNELLKKDSLNKNEMTEMRQIKTVIAKVKNESLTRLIDVFTNNNEFHNSLLALMFQFSKDINELAATVEVEFCSAIKAETRDNATLIDTFHFESGIEWKGHNYLVESLNQLSKLEKEYEM